MMGVKVHQPKLLYNFSLEDKVPSGHILRRIEAAIDFSFVRSLTKDTYSHTGQPSIDPVVIFKTVLLSYLYNMASERRVCERANMDLSWRWFLGYQVDEAVPDHSVLSKACNRFGPKVYEAFFSQVIQLCEQRGLIAGGILYLDATMVKANASLQSLRARGIVEQLRPVGEFVEEMWVANESEADHQPPRPKKPRSGRPPSGRPSQKSEAKTNIEKVSTTDPDAQLFRKEKTKSQLVHKVHMAADAKNGIVTAVLTRPATEHDSQVVATVLEKYQKTVGKLPGGLVADKGYDSQAATRTCLKRNILPFIPRRERINSQGTDRSTFHYDSAKDVFICQNGNELHPYCESYVDHRTIYRPKLRSCQGCIDKPECAPGSNDRTIHRSWHASETEFTDALRRTPTGRELLRRRSQVAERPYADAKVRHGFRTAQFRGRWKMQIQSLMTASTMNIKKLALAPAV